MLSKSIAFLGVSICNAKYRQHNAAHLSQRLAIRLDPGIAGNLPETLREANFRIVRIIAGEFRGRRLLPPQGDQTRPVTDRVKQSVFDILQPVLPDAVVYDIFCGTGSFGLEALSRGCARVVFFERHRPTLALLRRNIETLGVQTKCAIESGDVFARMGRAGDARATVVFLDPPYRFLQEQPEALHQLAADVASHHLAPEGIVVFRHDIADELSLDPLTTFDRRDYGGMTVELMRVG
jgi:16S rRNA (guanine966-N2)-methyltransferase